MRDYFVVVGLYLLAGMSILGALVTVAGVGKPRRPIEPQIAVSVVLFNAFSALILIGAAVTYR